MADRVVIMSNGVIEQIGTPKQVFREPASRFVAEFVGSNNILEGTVEKIVDGQLTTETELGQVTAMAPRDQALELKAKVQMVISSS